jgi:hypothetical protein
VTFRAAAGWGLAWSLLLPSLALGAPPTAMQAEVGYLLQYVEQSGCEFYRNGRWYDGSHARAHLSDKYQYLAARNQINTTEEFIARAATISSVSGHPYQIRCQASAPIDSNRWLLAALAAHRKAKSDAQVH